MGTRDPIRFEANERVDLGDLNALQSNARSYSHLAWKWFTAGTSPAPSHVQSGFDITPNSPANSSVNIGNGVAVGGIVLEDGATIEHGVFYGQEGPSSQALSFTGQPVGTYSIYIRPSLDAGQVGTRIFWNANTEAEEADNIDTRYVFGWDVTFATSSPGTEWQKIGEVAWNGATVSSGDITKTRDFYWEGTEPGFAVAEWGPGNDRNTDRAQYGIFNEDRWNQALRRQLRDIIDGSGNWFDAAQADLAETRAHIDTTVDAHSSTPEWTGQVLFTGGAKFDGTLVMSFGSYPEFDSPALISRRWTFQDLAFNSWEDTGTRNIAQTDWETGPDANVNSLRVNLGTIADTTVDPSFFLPLNAIMPEAGNVGNDGDIQFATFTTYYHKAVANDDGYFSVDIQRRKISTSTDGSWTNIHSYEVGRGVGNAIGSTVSAHTEVFAHTIDYLYDYRIKIRFGADTTNVPVALYGGQIGFFTDKLLV